jgi:hypothetical protein
MIAPPRPRQDERELLVEEARARQRRRQAAAAAIVALASAAAFIGYSLLGGNTPKRHGNSNPPRPGTTSATSCTRGRPRLLLSRTSGPPGTVVSITGCGCTHPVGQADRLGWLDSREAGKNPNLPAGQLWRRIPLTRTSRKSAKATFVVRGSDSVGRGLLDMWCGPASNGNAVAWFTVTA